MRENGGEEVGRATAIGSCSIWRTESKLSAARAEDVGDGEVRDWEIEMNQSSGENKIDLEIGCFCCVCFLNWN